MDEENKEIEEKLHEAEREEELTERRYTTTEVLESVKKEIGN